MRNITEVLESKLQGDLSEEMSDFILTLAIESEDREEARPCICCNNSITQIILDKVKGDKASFKPSKEVLNTFLRRFNIIWEWETIKRMQGGRDIFDEESLNLLRDNLELDIKNNNFNNAKTIASILFRELTEEEITRMEAIGAERLQTQRLNAIKEKDLKRALDISEKQGVPLSQDELRMISA